MPYRLKYEYPEIKRDIDHLPGHLRQRVRRAIKDLTINPRPGGTKELRNRPGRWRIAIDSWRIIYDIDDTNQILTIIAVRRKTGPETYQDLS